MADRDSTRSCKRCRETKALDQFPRCVSGRHGRGARCFSCMRDARIAASPKPKVCWLEKPCVGCGLVKPLTLYPRAVAGIDGREATCSACKSKRRDPERKRASQSRWSRTQSGRESRARYRESHAAAIAERKRGRDRRAEYARRKWPTLSPEERARRLEARRDASAKRRAVRAMLRVLRARAKALRKTDPSLLEQAHWRRSQTQKVKKLRRKGREARPIPGWVIAAIHAERCTCPYCGDALTRANRTLDHMDPLARGGEHDASNLVACCRSCNSRKSKTPFDRWLRQIPASRRIECALIYIAKHETSEAIAA